VRSAADMLKTKMNYAGCVQVFKLQCFYFYFLFSKDSLKGMPNDDRELAFLTKTLCTLYPNASPFEKPGFRLCPKEKFKSAFKKL
jgi:hypothetical protein